MTKPSAIAETKNASRPLDDEKTRDALAALERASGKLNVVLARDTNLALAQIDVDVTVYDVYTTVDAMKKPPEAGRGLSRRRGSAKGQPF